MSRLPIYWRIRLSAAAEADFEQILQWTAEHFGEDQADVYAQTLVAALDALKEGPSLPGVKARDDVSEGVFTLHAARSGRKARHLVVCRIESDGVGKIIQVLRILHDAMDVQRHLPSD